MWTGRVKTQRKTKCKNTVLLHDKVTRCFSYKPSRMLNMLLVNLAACVQHRALSSLCISDLLLPLRDDGSGYPNGNSWQISSPPLEVPFRNDTNQTYQLFSRGCLPLPFLSRIHGEVSWTMTENNLSTLQRTAHCMSGMVQMQPLVKTTPAMRELAEIWEKRSYQCRDPKKASY